MSLQEFMRRTDIRTSFWGRVVEVVFTIVFGVTYSYTGSRAMLVWFLVWLAWCLLSMIKSALWTALVVRSVAILDACETSSTPDPATDS